MRSQETFSGAGNAGTGPRMPSAANVSPASEGNGLLAVEPTNVSAKRRWYVRRRLTAARRLWRAEMLFLVVLAAFAVLALYARAYAYFAWDQRVAVAVQSISLPGTDAIMRAGSYFSDGPNAAIVSAVALLIFLGCGRRTEAAGLFVSIVGGTLINHIMKFLIGRPRPTLEHVKVSGSWPYESFPSGHVTFYVCFFGFFFFTAYALLPKGSLKRRAICSLTVLPVLLVGLSRVYLGAHWPSDTLGAYLLSGLWLAASLHLYRRWKERSTFHMIEEEGDKNGGDMNEGAHHN